MLVSPDAEGNVTRQKDLPVHRVRLDVLPLAEGDPPNVLGKNLHVHQVSAAAFRQRQQPRASSAWAAVFRLPPVPGRQSTVFLHQDAEQRVVGQPLCVLHLEGTELEGARRLPVEVAL